MPDEIRLRIVFGCVPRNSAASEIERNSLVSNLVPSGFFLVFKIVPSAQGIAQLALERPKFKDSGGSIPGSTLSERNRLKP